MSEARALHIVIATDGSEHAREAIRRARVLLDMDAVAAITVVAVVKPVVTLAAFADLPPQVWTEMEEAAQRAARQALGDARATLADTGARIETLLLSGDPATEIVRAAREARADAIVVGSRGWGEVKALLLGSVSERVLHAAHCPVLVVRPGEQLQ